MPGIICAIRGGQASRPTINKSIQMAVETGLPLYFLYVINLKFLTHTSSSRINIISKEMKEMGEFILLTAQEEAQSKGVEAMGVVRQGNVRDEIEILCKEVRANYVILGVPKDYSEERNVFTQDHLMEFGKRLEEESGAKIVLAEILSNSLN
jgi:hypothetical protein